MALRAVPDHPKFSDLKRRLGVGKAITLGYLECLWHFTGRFTPHGDIGKYDDAAIEAWLEYDGPAGSLISALVESRWLDRDDMYRLLVHDWACHADKATKQAVSRSKREMCTPTGYTTRAYRDLTETDMDTLGGTSDVLSPLPVPVPEPVPVPVPGPESGAVPESLPEPAPGAEARRRGRSLNAVEIEIIRKEAKSEIKKVSDTAKALLAKMGVSQ